MNYYRQKSLDKKYKFNLDASSKRQNAFNKNQLFMFNMNIKPEIIDKVLTKTTFDHIKDGNYGKKEDKINNKQEIDKTIKQINIFVFNNTIISANFLRDRFIEMGITATIISRAITNKDIDECEKDPNLYLFIYCPQWNLSRPYKNIKPLPKNKYFLYQVELLNQSEYPYQSINMLI